jgi:succinate dehydrogenase / fumarate reductase cytochrome b subunit
MEKNVTASASRSFWLGKVFSLFGIAPLGFYVFLHLYDNLRSLYGEESFNLYLAEKRSLPLIVPIMVLVVWIPIAFHGIYGLLAMKKSRPNLGRFPFFENLKYVLQRLSGIGLLLFVPAHVYKTRIEPTLSHTPLDFKHMMEGLHEPLTLAVYCLGVLGVAYHLANGIWQFSIGWGIATTQKGMRKVQVISYLAFIILLVMGAGAVWGFISAS